MAFAAAALPFLPMIMQGAGAIFSIVQGITGANNANAQGDIAMQQAKLQAQQVDREGARVLSADVAGAGKGGVVPTTGSPAAVNLQNARDIELRRLDELYQGKVAKYEAGIRANNSLMSGIGGALKPLGLLGSSFANMFGPTTGTPAATGIGSVSPPRGTYSLGNFSVTGGSY
jgi:hypothetical protein